MNDRRPGTYYVPNEGLRYWDGEQWLEVEPQPNGSERPDALDAAQQPTGGRHARGRRALPWAATCMAVIASVVIGTLLQLGGWAGTALATASDAITALVSPSPTSHADASAPVRSTPATPVTKKHSPAPSARSTSAAKATKKPLRPPSTTAAPARPVAPATKKPSPPSPAKPAATAAPEPADNFDDAYAREIAVRIVEDIATADERMLDRPGNARTTMASLSEDMGNLEEAGLPDVKDQVDYVALIRTLAESYHEAEWELSDDQITEAVARYTIARKATSELVTTLNQVLGTKHRLPAWS
jgi:hypothetical protein